VLLYKTRDVIGRVIGPDGRPGHAHCPFPSRFGDPLVWTPILEVQLLAGVQDDLCIITGGCTLSTKLFHKHDAHGKPTKDYGSAMLRSVLMLYSAPAVRPYLIAARPPGLLCGLGSGTNSTELGNLTPYQQHTRPDIVRLPCNAPYAALYVAPASNDAQAGDFVEAYATSEEYAYLSALLLV
jgi:hypothetical protein